MTWYATDMRDPRRITVTFQDSLRSEHTGETKVHGELELWGDSKTVPYASMLVESPEKLDELAKAIQVAAANWRHCIEECDCYAEEAEEAPRGGIKIISFGGADVPGLWVPDEEEDSDPPEDDPPTKV